MDRLDDSLGYCILIDITLQTMLISIFFFFLTHYYKLLSLPSNIKYKKQSHFYLILILLIFFGQKYIYLVKDNNYLSMRLFVSCINFQVSPHPQAKPLKILRSYNNSIKSMFFIQLEKIQTTDQLMDTLLFILNIQHQQVIITIKIQGLAKEKCLQVVRGHKIKDYRMALGQSQSSILDYQLHLDINLTNSQQSQPQPQQKALQPREQPNPNPKKNEQQSQANQIYRYSNQLFQIMYHDDLFQFKNMINIFLKYKTMAFVKALFNLYHQENGYTLIHSAIYFNKYAYLAQILKDFGEFINVNYISADGWLPFELALTLGNKKAIQILIQSKSINLNLNFPTKSIPIIYQLINTINLELIDKVIRRCPLQFEQLAPNHQKNAYQFIWKHNRFTESQKIQMIKLMHEKHLQFYDYYRTDAILYSSCKEILPSAARRLSPKKQTIYNPNLKIISGELIKCRSPPHFSKKIFLSVNSYIGAIEQYEISIKLNLQNDKQKLEEYQKTRHLSLQQIQSIQSLPEKQKSWYMKKQWYCLVIKEKRGAKLIYACLHQSTAHQWVSEIKQAFNAWNNLQHKQYNPKISKNYIKITDSQLKIPSAKKVMNKGMIDLFSKRLSLCEPMQQTKDELSLNIMKQQPMMKSKSHYNTTANSSMANEEVLPLTFQYKDFKMLQMLGEGSFGQVFLVQCLRNKKFYALKTFSKKKIILSKQAKFVVAEVNILKNIKHPFIITLHFTFQTPCYIYLGLQYCQGKDMGKHLNQQFTFPEADVKIYAAQIVLALQYIHNLGIIYRDLKPQNIMLGKDGHILLVDFGLSKKTQNNFAKTFCGSPAYLSPEMLEKKGVGRETDFFSLGVVIFQFIYGEPPFYSQNIHILYDNIQKGALTFPRKINETTMNFLSRLLDKQPQARLGSKSINQIKDHPYFSGIKWQSIMRRQIPGPRRPLLDDIESIQSEQELINMFHEDFDYSEENYKVNRFKNFSFVREEQFL